MSLKLKLFCVFIIYCVMVTFQVQSAAVHRKREMHCSKENPSARINCGWPKITSSECTDMGCCFDSSSSDNKCFKANNGDESHLSRVKRQVDLYDANAGSKDGKVYADATFAQWNDGKADNSGKVLYANSGAQATNGEIGFNGEVGFIRHKAITPYNFGVEHDVMTAGVDVGFGKDRVSVMGKAAVVDGSLHLGPANLNYGVAFDTGFTGDGRNVEAKFLGNGFKLGKDGVQLCVVFCVGVDW